MPNLHKNRKLRAKQGKRKYRLSEGIFYPVRTKSDLLKRAQLKRVQLERHFLMDQSVKLQVNLLTRRYEQDYALKIFKEVPSIAALIALKRRNATDTVLDLDPNYYSASFAESLAREHEALEEIRNEELV